MQAYNKAHDLMQSGRGREGVAALEKLLQKATLQRPLRKSVLSNLAACHTGSGCLSRNIHTALKWYTQLYK